MSPAEPASLAAAVAKAGAALSRPALKVLSSAFREGLRPAAIRAAVPSTAYAAVVDELLASVGDAPPSAVALALDAVAETQRAAPTTSLVWTGPTTSSVSVRRTDQALLQLINASSKRVIVVSFAVYKVPNVAATLRKAAARGVLVDLIVETEDASGGKVAFDGWQAFDGEGIRLWTWAGDRRPVTSSGKRATLHAKCAVGDRRRLLVSSANLTEFAFNFNMELGILVRDGNLPATVARHFDGLMDSGELCRI